jgi:hypothetical protein
MTLCAWAQIRHKIAALAWLQERLPTAHFILGGHSVGAYMCLSVMDAVAPARILQLHMLMPTVIDIGSTPNAARLAPLFTRLGRRATMGVARALRALPGAVQRGLIRAYMPSSPRWVVDVALSLLHEDVANAALTMGAHEMAEIRGQALALDSAAWEGRLRWHFAYGEDDGWVPAALRDRIGARFTASESSVCAADARVPHAFCVSHSADVAAVAWDWTVQAMGEAAK